MKALGSHFRAGSDLALVFAVRIGVRRPAPTLPTHSNPPVKFVKINMSCDQQESGGDQVLAPSGGIGEPRASDPPCAFPE
jgi:hypothetical protein